MVTFIEWVIGLSPKNPHFIIAPVVSLRQWDIHHFFTVMMAEPVMHLKLDPGGGQQVYNGGGFKFRTRQQFFTDYPRIRGQQFLIRWFGSEVPGHISPKPHTGTTHFGLFQVVKRAVGMPGR